MLDLPKPLTAEPAGDKDFAELQGQLWPGERYVEWFTPAGEFPHCGRCLVARPELHVVTWFRRRRQTTNARGEECCGGANILVKPVCDLTVLTHIWN